MVSLVPHDAWSFGFLLPWTQKISVLKQNFCLVVKTACMHYAARFLLIRPGNVNWMKFNQLLVFCSLNMSNDVSRYNIYFELIMLLI